MPLTVDAFEAIAGQVGATDGTYCDLHKLERTLRAAAAVVGEDEREVLEILADVCPYDLAEPTDVAEPYRAAIWLVDGRRTATPEDLTDEQIAFLALIRDQIGCPWLKARVCDVLWVTKRDHLAARAAVATWASQPVTEEAWFDGGSEVWRRALDLAHRLKAAEGLRIQESVLNAVLGAEQFAFACQASDLLLTSRLPEPDGLKVLAQLTELAQDRTGREERHLLEAARRWAEKLGRDDTRADLLHRIVQSWMAEGESHAEGVRRSPMLAARSFEGALQAFRKIPRKARERLEIVEFEKVIRQRHKAVTSTISEELSAIRTEMPAEAREMAERALRVVSGRDPADVLIALGGLFPARPYADLYEPARDAEQGSISSLFESISLTPEGRKARVTGADDEIHGVPAPVWRLMEHSFNMHVALTVQTALASALYGIQSEHVLREQHFADLVVESGYVPRDHRVLFTHGLWCGYRGDIAASIHILVPQIEAFVRAHLQAHGVATTTIEAGDSVENEVGLSTLVKKDELEQVFGPDLSLYLRLMFEGPAGLNVRNTVAHGLLTDEAVETVTNLFVWWFALYLVTRPVAVARRTRSRDAADPATSGPVAAAAESEADDAPEGAAPM